MEKNILKKDTGSTKVKLGIYSWDLWELTTLEKVKMASPSGTLKELDSIWTMYTAVGDMEWCCSHH